MVVKNIQTGRKFDVAADFWENNIVSKGLSGKYEIVEDDAPIEVKQLSVEMKKKTKKK